MAIAETNGLISANEMNDAMLKGKLLLITCAVDTWQY